MNVLRISYNTNCTLIMKNISTGLKFRITLPSL